MRPNRGTEEEGEKDLNIDLQLPLGDEFLRHGGDGCLEESRCH